MASDHLQSTPLFPNEVLEGQWSSGLFDCHEDYPNCLLTCFCPCITMGMTAEIIDGGIPSCGAACCMYYFLSKAGCAWLYGGTYRTKLRRIFALPETPSSDWLLHCFCCLCSLCQEFRELKNRGIDPCLGWQVNVEKWHQEGLKPPIVAAGMNR